MYARYDWNPKFSITLLTPINVFGPLEESRDVVLEDGEGLVELLQDADDGVVALHVVHGLLHGHLSVKTPVWMKKSINFS